MQHNQKDPNQNREGRKIFLQSEAYIRLQHTNMWTGWTNFPLTFEIAACPRMSSGDVGSSIHRGLNSARLDTQLMASATSHLWLASII